MEKVARAWKGTEFLFITCYEGIFRLIRPIGGGALENSGTAEAGAKKVFSRKKVA